MPNLQTTFAGLSLKNPIIVSSSGLTSNAKSVRALEDSNAGAVVLKSLFEEQIALDADRLHGNDIYYPEGGAYLDAAVRTTHVTAYMELIGKAKRTCRIPIIASINCYTADEWINFANLVEKAGADALEINVLALRTDRQYTYGSFEQQHIDILRRIRAQISIPIIMKLGHNLTNPVALIDQLYANGAQAVVLFNRFYQPDVDINTLELTGGDAYSTSKQLPESLRWVGIASAAVVGPDYAISGGVHSGADVVKSLLVGAKCVEMCSAIYQNGNDYICYTLQFLQEWMTKHGFGKLSDFCGRINCKDLEHINVFERTQFLRYYGSKE